MPRDDFDYLFEQANAKASDWETPIAISSLTGPAPLFPVEALPCWMRAQAEQVAKELQVAVDLPATLALVALSIIFAGRWNVLVKNTWKESLNLYRSESVV